MVEAFKVTDLCITLSQKLGLFFPISELQCDTKLAHNAFWSILFWRYTYASSPFFLFYVSVNAKKLSFWMPKFCEMNRACLEGDIWEQKNITVTNNFNTQCYMIFCVCFVVVIVVVVTKKGIFRGRWSFDLPVRGKAHLCGHGCDWWYKVCAVHFHGSERRDRHTTAFLPLHKQTMTNGCNIVWIVTGV